MPRPLLAALVATVTAQDIATLQQGQVVSNFTAKSVYLGDSDKPSARGSSTAARA